MSYQEYIKKGLLQKERVGFDQIIKVIVKARRNLKSASILMKNGDEEGGYQFAYEAMLLAARALVFSYGLRPRAAGSHKISIDFAEKVLGAEYKILIHKFDKMRRKRHYLIYGAGLAISKTEAENAIDTAEEFIEKIQKFIQKKSPAKFNLKHN